eukprot:scaffold462_cov195-Pinguiococcus_pyrenoidosus.AAC.78
MYTSGLARVTRSGGNGGRRLAGAELNGRMEPWDWRRGGGDGLGPMEERDGSTGTRRDAEDGQASRSELLSC